MLAAPPLAAATELVAAAILAAPPLAAATELVAAAMLATPPLDLELLDDCLEPLLDCFVDGGGDFVTVTVLGGAEV